MLLGKEYVLLPQRYLNLQPSQEVAVDLIGPWPIKNGNKYTTFMAFTIIDPVTNLTELIWVRVDNKTVDYMKRKFALT